MREYSITLNDREVLLLIHSLVWAKVDAENDGDDELLHEIIKLYSRIRELRTEGKA